MLACTALVGCTSDDDVVVNNDDAKNGNEYYVAVNFAMPGNASSRAVTHNGFEDGTDAENKVNNAVFFFLNANGQSCADACYISTNLTNTDHTGDDTTTGEGENATTTLGAFDEETSTVIVMENPTEIPSSIVAVINMGDITKANSNYGSAALLSNRPSLDQIKAVVGNYATATWKAMPTTGMVMSNTAYKNANNEIVIGAPVSAANIITSDGDSYNVGDVYSGDVDPVTIYVEKVLAKVEVSNSITANTTSDVTESLISAGTDNATSSAETTFTVDITGWWLDSAPTTSLLLKDINNISYAWDWNDIANYRSYWGNSCTSDNNQSYVNYKYSEASTLGTALYCQENTSQPTNVETQAEDDATTGADNTYEVNNRTKVVVSATIKNGGNAVDLVKWYGKYYTEDAFMITFANLQDVQKYYIESENADGSKTYTSLTKDNLQIVANQDVTGAISGEIDGSTTNQVNQTVNGTAIRNYEAVVTLKDVTTLYTAGTDGKMTQVTSIDDVNESLKAISKILYWKDGKTYYYVEVEHYTDGTGDTATPYYGVVRNHLYKVNFTGLKGLGTPVPQSDKIIIPEKPGDSDMNTYISAEIIIMSYRVVSNDVVLE